MTRRKRLCLLLALSACGAQSKLVLATTGMEPTLDLDAAGYDRAPG